MRHYYKRIFIGGILLFLAIFFLNLNIQPSHAMTIQTDGRRNYEQAYKVLELVNKERRSRGLHELKMDTSLLDVAMQRAAESAVRFSHIRPNGKNCFSISDRLRGENLCAGVNTASAAMKMWMSSDGHRSNILHKSFKSIGIGYFQVNGFTYWAQSFGTATAKVPDVSSEKNTVQASVQVPASKMRIDLNMTRVLLGVGGSDQIHIYATYRGTNQKCELTSGAVFYSSNESVVSVSEQGQIDARQSGTAVVSVTAGNIVRNIYITITDETSAFTCAGAKYHILSKSKKTHMTNSCRNIARNVRFLRQFTSMVSDMP